MIPGLSAQNKAAKRSMTPGGFAMLGPDTGKLSGTATLTRPGDAAMKLTR